MAQTRRYLNVADQINMFRWRVKVPAFVLSQPSLYMEGEIEPIYAIMDPNAAVLTVLPIARLVQLFQANTMFAVVKPEDAVEMFHWIDQYLLFSEPQIQIMNQAVISYCRVLCDFREFFYRRIFLRALNKNPALKKDYVDRKGSMADILALFGGLLNETSSVNMDPLKALARPPIQLPPLPEQVMTGPREVYAIGSNSLDMSAPPDGMDAATYA